MRKAILAVFALLGLAAIMLVSAGWQDPFPCLPGKPGCKPKAPVTKPIAKSKAPTT